MKWETFGKMQHCRYQEDIIDNDDYRWNVEDYIYIIYFSNRHSFN